VRSRLATVALLLPAVVLVVVGFLYPYLTMLVAPAADPHPDVAGAVVKAVTDPYVVDIVARTVRVAGMATALSVAFGFPVAWAISRASARWRGALLLAVTFPLLLSTVVRSFAWIVLLGRDGLISRALWAVGITSGPTQLLYTEFAMVLGLAQLFMPLLVLTAYSSLAGLDPTIEEAARGMGARAAVELIAQLALELPGELVLIALGPLTNVARLVTEHPAAAAALREIVHMGGAAFAQGNITPAAEFNTFCDPEAARIVLTSGLPIRLVPLDVTRRTGFPRTLSARLASSTKPAAAAAGAMLLGLTAAHQARAGAEVCHVHDASAVAAVLAPEAMTWQRGAVEVECAGELSRGALVVDILGRTDWPATVDIALSAREGVLEELLMSRLEGR
jgi:putative spermidine/putrescine transport system permease protein